MLEEKLISLKKVLIEFTSLVETMISKSVKGLLKKEKNQLFRLGIIDNRCFTSASSINEVFIWRKKGINILSIFFGNLYDFSTCVHLIRIFIKKFSSSFGYSVRFHFIINFKFFKV